MNEKLASLLNALQDAAAQAGNTAADAVRRASEKAAELLSAAKARVRIASLEGEVGAALREVGELLYATHTGSPTDSKTLLKKLQEIDALKAEIKTLHEETGKAGGPRACPACGAAPVAGDVFCRECGGKL